MATRYVIVGAGLAGHQAALELSRSAPGAAIMLIGAEGGLPYDRTSLSKSVLLQDEPDLAQLELSGARQYAELGIDYRPGLTVAAIDRESRAVVTTEGIGFAYDKLLLATGSRPRRLFQDESIDGAYLRILEESLDLRRAIAGRGKIVVVGGGFIGLETAAAARSKGCDVTVIEASPRLLARGMPHFLSNWTLDLHRSHGVRFAFETPVDALHKAGTVWLVSAGGEMHEADAVLIGIGVVPNVELAAAAGLAVNDGVVVDAFCRTEDANVFAAGEATSHPNAPDGTLRRVESWKTAMDHGIAAARNMSGTPAPFANTPWFWSDQYDQNIQSVGFPAEGAQFMMVEGATTAAWTLVALDQDDTIVGAVAANRGRDISVLKRAMQAKAQIPTAMRLVDISAEWCAA
ncbi:MAG: FAD-dependent oxidoreductase [Sphingomonas bacterium]|uniref:NAD(P)/FAD-dependent oxidoreductase n=1 Tax=Sphingomonas bacterium TaxID=1895847 RepID=UPI0026322FEE|nr:FAD-dependent oxidoreductase [Sphingomonas bacterium]MDB5704503.1 FAD-dependent oxidoreductase [Sphingomonas bacterium]